MEFKIFTTNKPNTTLDTILKGEKTLIIGAGEIGKSLKNVLSEFYDVKIRDVEEDDDVNSHWYRIINICYPYSNQFVEITKEYIKKYKPELTIIHSTVKPGTTRLLGKDVVHSPVSGRHPHLEEGIKTFIKFIGGNDVFSTFKAVDYLGKANLKTHVMANSEATEVAKILCTTTYGWNIILMKEVAKLCEQFNVPFTEVYTEWNNAYNNGYALLNEFRFMRPVLFPMDGPIGGHCVINNCHLLDTEITKYILKKNDELIKAEENNESISGGVHRRRSLHRNKEE